jgi:hypothetical protein
MDIPTIFDQVAAQMRADLQRARAALKHPGLKGDSFEEIFRRFLRDYLPTALDISTGVLVDSSGAQSRQLDVIISDARQTPIFYKNQDTRVIPVECVYAVIEVKADLTQQELERAFENMQSVRKLQKRAYIRPSGPIIQNERMYGREWEIWPINYHIFAFDSPDLIRLGEWLQIRYTQAQPPAWERIDTICVLDKGVICHRLTSGQFSALPEPDSVVFPCPTNRALLLFYTLISVQMFQTRLPSFRFTDYLGQITFSPS